MIGIIGQNFKSFVLFPVQVLQFFRINDDAAVSFKGDLIGTDVAKAHKLRGSHSAALDKACHIGGIFGNGI